MGEIMKKGGEDYYYQIRAEFNEDGDSFKFLFLNRSCFNGLMRFNSRGGFNVPFGHKQYRFSKAYITKIVNQVKRLEILFHDKDWEFRISDWKDILALTNPNDFVYLDPPYIGRHTDYFNNWGETDAIELAKQASQLKCNFALSMWLENKYRKNQHIENHWPSTIIKTYEHFYHIGASESLRNSIREALVLKEMITCR
jgi:DNA adenine methylase